YELLVGFGAAWLAFSGLESISQLSPAMRFPLRRTTRLAMTAVIITIIMTSPVLTALSVGLLPDQIKATQSERFISELGGIIGGFGLKLAVVLTASSLLLFASNTAIIGSYHVFLALARQGFLPKILELRNRAFNTPHIAVLIATSVPALLILLTQGQLLLLGDMYAFGLLGAFFFSSLSLDAIRWRLGRRDLGFWVGVLTTLMVMVALGHQSPRETPRDLLWRRGHAHRHGYGDRRAPRLVRRHAGADSICSAASGPRLPRFRRLGGGRAQGAGYACGGG